jgi:preprotein translocase subunit SecA
MMPMTKWRHGLHQAIEAKEGVPISKPDDTLARMSFQRFFRLYKQLSGMTGTGEEAVTEFWRVYRLPVVTIPPNRPRQRVDLPDRLFPDVETKWGAVVEEVVRRHATGQPVLIGTRSISSSEALAARLQLRGVQTSVLNATRHLEEAQIIAAAGKRGQITIATNMAGRGTDIELASGVAQLGGLHVIATERHESGRIDRQLFGRAGRQGDPGSAQAFISADDELLRRYAGARICGMLKTAAPGGGLSGARIARWAVKRAQSMAQRKAFLQRQQVLRQDDWLDQALSFAGGTA